MNSVKDYISKLMGGSGLDEEDDDKPYDSIARDGADISDENKSGDAVSGGSAPPSLPTMGVGRQPSAPVAAAAPVASSLLDDYNKREAVAQAIRQKNLEKNSDVNTYRAIAQIARAGNPNIQNDSGLYDSLIKQNDAQAAAASSDLGRRANFMKTAQQAQIKQGAIDAANNRADAALSERARHNKASEDIQASNVDSKADKASEKSSQLQDAAMKDTVGLLESARGSPAVQQAEKDLYAAKKVDRLFSKYKDLDQLSPNMANLAITEVAKIASGASPDDHMLNLLNPNSFKGSMATLWQKVTNSPTPANAGEFLKQYRDYANDLREDAKGLITDRYGRIIDSNERRLGDDNSEKLRKNYIHRFDAPGASNTTNSEIGAKAPAAKPGVGSIINVKGKRYRVGADGDSLEPI